MKRIKALKLGMICALCFSLVCMPAYAEELTESTTNASETVEEQEIPDAEITVENSDETVEIVENVETAEAVENAEDISTTVDTNQESETKQEPVKENVKTESSDKNEATGDENKLTKSWVTISATNKNVTVKGTNHYTLTLVLENVETQEIHKEVLSTEQSLAKTFVIPNGKYKVSIEEPTITEEHCIMSEYLEADGGDVIFSITFMNINKELVNPPAPGEEIPGWQIILKNNMVFIILILGCGIYLLVRKIQKSREE